ncbi:hypothetical protein GMO_17810 [Gluconobacter morbifer G707]|uniref:Uncharacterized protein n=1 Tax=Gluconobacter morbifer G707 TaxID=1088869 RepID=G6XK52_9PROT|nr:hypothetical protein GMO_17810 [Gluconobacter morbifer G707]
MGNRASCIVAALEVRLLCVNRMGEDGARAQQAGLVIDVQIGRAIGKEFAHPGVFRVIFQKMRLHEQVIVRGKERAGKIQLFGCAGRCKAGRDGIELSSASVPAFDQGGGLVVAALGRIAQVIRRVAVHQDFPGDHAGIEPFGFLEKGFDGLRMDRAVHGSRRRADAQEFLQECAGDRPGIGQVTEPGFCRKDVLFQPFQKLFAIGGDDRELRVMDVCVHHPGGDQFIRIVRDGCGRRNLMVQVVPGASGDNPSFPDKDQAIRFMKDGLHRIGFKRVGAKGQERATNGSGLAHANSLSHVPRIGEAAPEPWELGLRIRKQSIILFPLPGKGQEEDVQR